MPSDSYRQKGNGRSFQYLGKRKHALHDSVLLYTLLQQLPSLHLALQHAQLLVVSALNTPQVQPFLSEVPEFMVPPPPGVLLLPSPPPLIPFPRSLPCTAPILHPQFPGSIKKPLPGFAS